MDQNQEALPNGQVGDRAGNDLLGSGSFRTTAEWPDQVEILALSKTPGDTRVRWTVTFAGCGAPFVVTTATLLSYRRLWRHVFRERGAPLLPLIDNAEWHDILREYLRRFPVDGGQK